jgi:hypothetical protein
MEGLARIPVWLAVQKRASRKLSFCAVVDALSLLGIELITGLPASSRFWLR